jgi:hypothetical protein
MEKYRELVRAFFDLFLILSCFIGCGQSMYWFEEALTSIPKKNTNVHNTHYSINEEEFITPDSTVNYY